MGAMGTLLCLAEPEAHGTPAGGEYTLERLRWGVGISVLFPMHVPPGMAPDLETLESLE